MTTPADHAQGYTFTKPEGLLAHYTSASAAFEHILASGRLRLSPYWRMRDPAENKDILPSIERAGLRPGEDRAIDDLHARIKARRDGMRVLSFTRDAEDRGGEFPTFDCCWARPRMWEQYGAVHRGVCLLFELAALERAIPHEWARHNIYKRDVDYTREGIVGALAAEVIHPRMFDDKEHDIAVQDYLEGHDYTFFFVKSDDFATEHEYRIVLRESTVGGSDYRYLTYREALVGVVLGERFPEWQQAGAARECSKLGVMLGRMDWEQGWPEVLPVGP